MGTSTSLLGVNKPAVDGTGPRRPRSPLRLGYGVLTAVVALGWSSVAMAGEAEVPLQRPLSARAAAPSSTAAPLAPPTLPSTEPSPATQPEAATAPAAAPAPSTPTAAPARAAAPSPRAAAPAVRQQTPAPDLHTEHRPEPSEPLAHGGFTFDGRVGATGCLRGLCGPESHNAGPGLRLDGFLGGNIRGWVDLGISGGWGKFRAEAEQDANLLRLYGIEPAHLQQAAVAMGQPLGFNPFALQVHGTKLTTARVGPSLRVHLIPRGRGIAYVGTGFGYSLFRARYDTAVGDVKMDFHGIDVPIQAGAGVQITDHLAAVAQFDYTWAKYPAAQFDHPQQALTLPVRLLDAAAETSGNSVGDQLPQYWSLGLGLRARI